ncbi:MAG: Na+/H+ antiporter NhaC family protein, partial [Firmicutes bacterium]|nr:Na+/H+ antiporter NhaC family protein [Bacillota bacterium]
MEKKSTRTAYLVAVCAIIVLLVILAMSYKNAPILVEDAASPFAGTFWSLLPPICAIVLALISKEVYSSLFFGCIVGALLYTQFSPWDTLTSLVGADYGLICVLADSWDMGIIIFLVELGIISDLMNKGGGSEAFGRWAKDKVKSRASAQLMTMLLGVLIFVDDYFNCLTV